MTEEWDDGNDRIQNLMWGLMSKGVRFSPADFLFILHKVHNGELGEAIKQVHLKNRGVPDEWRLQ